MFISHGGTKTQRKTIKIILSVPLRLCERQPTISQKHFPSKNNPVNPVHPVSNDFGSCLTGWYDSHDFSILAHFGENKIGQLRQRSVSV
jgi:hypothetical protein